MTPNRVVAVLTPLVFAPLAGAAATWLADNAPGVNISSEDLTAVFISGTVIALAPALQWLHGWQKHEAREAEIERAVELANVAAFPVAGPAADVAHEDDDSDRFDDYEEYDEYDEFDEGDEAGDGSAPAEYASW